MDKNNDRPTFAQRRAAGRRSREATAARFAADAGELDERDWWRLVRGLEDLAAEAEPAPVIPLASPGRPRVNG